METEQTNPSVDEVVAATQKEIERTLSEMIHTIEKWFAVSPFDFIEGGRQCPGTYIFPSGSNSFNRFYPWAESWMGSYFLKHLRHSKLLEMGDPTSDATR